MSHPKSEEFQKQDENPFSGFCIDNNSILKTLESRYPCDKCSKSRKFFCYSCFLPHPSLANVIPKVKLPVKIDIIKHKREIDGKSTAAHAAVLASEDVNVYTYPDIPAYEEEKVVLIFPSHSALEISQLFVNSDITSIKPDFFIEYPKGFNRSTLLKSIPLEIKKQITKHASSKTLPITKAVFIDSTWNQSRGIYKDERIRKLPCVVLQNRVSQFWRHQRGSPRWYLATVEAIHQFVVEIHLNAWGVHPDYKGLECCFTDKSLEHYKNFKSEDFKAYNGQYDNLLYFFEHMYRLIHEYYDHDNLHAYKRRMQ